MSDPTSMCLSEVASQQTWPPEPDFLFLSAFVTFARPRQEERTEQRRKELSAYIWGRLSNIVEFEGGAHSALIHNPDKETGTRLLLEQFVLADPGFLIAPIEEVKKVIDGWFVNPSVLPPVIGDIVAFVNQA